MNEVTIEAIKPKTYTQSEIDQIKSELEKKNEEMNKKIKELEALQKETTKNTKELLDQLQSEINEYKEEIETLQKEINNLQSVLKKTSDTLRESADGIDAVLTPPISPEPKKDEKPETPTQTSPDSSSNQAPTDPSQPSTAQQPSLSTETSTQENPENGINQAPTDSSQLSSEKKGDDAQTPIPEIPSQVAPDGQNNHQEQVPQTVPIAPVVQLETTQPAQNLEVAPQQDPQIETQPQLSDAQKLAQVQQILGSFEAKFRNLQAESNSIAISAAELSSLDQLSGLLQQPPVQP